MEKNLKLLQRVLMILVHLEKKSSNIYITYFVSIDTESSEMIYPSRHNEPLELKIE